MRLARGALVTVAVLTVLALCGCSPVERTAVRLNDDGSVDFASCRAVPQVSGTESTASRRTGPGGTIDESTEVELSPEHPVDHLDVGQVVTFVGLPERWDRLDLWVQSDGGSPRDDAYAAVERSDLVVGQWYWGDGAPFTDYVPKHRCRLDD